jgi:hypothetical protein
VRVLNGIVIESTAKDVRIALEEKKTGQMSMAITEAERPERVYYRAEAVLEEAPRPAPGFEPLDLETMKAFPVSMEEAYKNWLFHGPLFQCIKEIHGISKQGIAATLAPAQPRDCIAGGSSRHWILDPIVLDAGPQLAILWARVHHDMTALPSGFQSLRLIRPCNAEAIQCRFEVKEMRGEHSFLADVHFADPDGNVLAMVEGLESTCSKALNRLASGVM